MFYTYLRTLVVFLLWIANGNAHYHNRERILPETDNYILVAPHRTWWDPIYMAFAARPKQFIVMAKKELFTNRMLAWWLKMCGAFPIDRENPSPDTIRYPITVLKKSRRSLLMFPSGSRYSKDVKGGVAVIAKMAKVKIVPSAYSGPLSFSGLLKGERIDMNFGEAIDISDIPKMNQEGIDEVARRIQEAFDRLDAENQTYHDGKNPNLLVYLARIPATVIALIWIVATLMFSFIASFVWDPDKHREWQK